ncbi:MAG TPA: M81 family metallopeptidase [Pirellulaceae bacterium]|nr:M81 family metallopeptidase [Pirellulaceae bacterium]
MRIGIIALLQESNTFIPRATMLRQFEEELLVSGEEMRRRFDGTHHEVGGMLHALAEEQVEAVPIFAARALPFGRIEQAAIDEILSRMWRALDAAGILNGVLVAPHGATVSEPYPDCDGHWLTELRRRVGPRPIIGTLDPHGNLSPAMVAACDALMSYRTNPHLDQRARGIDAARMIVATLRGEIQPTMAAAFPPLAINIERQCTGEEPCHALCRFADDQLADERILTNSIMLGFPYADVEEMGSATIAVTNRDPELARKTASELAQKMWELREGFAGTLIGVDESLDRAAKMEGPICLLDMGDNVGGGSPGDGTWLAEALLARKLPRSFVCLADPESVSRAQAAGAGNKVRLSMGGKTDDLHGPPLECEVTVRGLFDGKFQEPQPRHGGFTHMDQGPTAVVETDTGLTVMLTTRRMPPFSLRQLTTFGIEPEKYHLLVAKGVNAPIAAYREVYQHFLRVNTPGCTSADMLSLPYHHRRRPMFPFERETTWQP